MICFRSSVPNMRRSITHKLIACGLVLLLMAPLERAAAAQQPQQSQISSQTSSSSLPQAPLPSTDQNASGAQPGQDQQQANPAVGTAAAPYEKTTGIAATRPAGAVIAPSKQRRIHSIFIKVGIVAGAGAAIAAVALLSRSSPSQPH